MGTRSTFGAVAVVIALALGAWMLRGRAERSPGAGAARSEETADSTAAASRDLADPGRVPEEHDDGSGRRTGTEPAAAPASLFGSVRVPEGEELPPDLGLDDVQLDWRVPSSRTVETVRIEGQLVEVERFHGDRYVTFPGEDGVYEHADAPVGVALELHVVAGGPARVVAIPPLAPGERRQLDVELDLGATLAGRVRDERGRAVEGVPVELRPLADAGPDDSQKCVTDVDGRFELRSLERREWSLSTSDFGGASDARTVDLALGSLRGVELELQQDGVLRGRVEWSDGTPARGFAVEIDGASVRRRELEGGGFVVPGLGSSPIRVVARGERDGEPGLSPELEVLPDGPPVVLVLRPIPRGIVRGRVLDADGAAIVRCQLEATASGQRELVQSDEDGVFEIALTEGEWTLHATADGFITTSVLVAAPFPPELKLVLPRGGRVLGRVVDPLGAPVADATVAGAWPRSARTDADGFFLVQLRTESAELKAYKYGYADSDPVTVTPPIGGMLEDVVLSLVSGCAVSGRVLDDRGLSLSDVEVEVGDESMTPDEHGQFRLQDLRAGPARVQVFEERTGRRAFAEVLLAADREAKCELRLRALEPVALRLRVQHGDRGVAAEISLSSSDVRLHARCAPDGLAELVLPCPGRVEAWIYAESDEEPPYRATLDVPALPAHEVALDLDQLQRAGPLEEPE